MLRVRAVLDGCSVRVVALPAPQTQTGRSHIPPPCARHAPASLPFICAAATGVAMMRYTGDPINVVRWLATTVAGVIAVVVYLIFMPELITMRALANSTELLITRMVIHPAIWAVLSALFTHVGRYMGAAARALGALAAVPCLCVRAVL